jgi:hypothetical protein
MEVPGIKTAAKAAIVATEIQNFMVCSVLSRFVCILTAQYSADFPETADLNVF